MVQRRFHYDVAFEHYLRANSIPYVAVDEAKRALTGAKAAQSKLKSFDFVVYSQSSVNLLVDVKGRKHSGKTGKLVHNWVTSDDVASLRQWAGLFGDGFEGAFLFLYWCDAQPPDALFHELFEFGERWYAVLAILLTDYEKHMRRRSRSWDTVSMAARIFDECAVPLKTLL